MACSCLIYGRIQDALLLLQLNLDSSSEGEGSDEIDESSERSSLAMVRSCICLVAVGIVVCGRLWYHRSKPHGSPMLSLVRDLSWETRARSSGGALAGRPR